MIRVLAMAAWCPSAGDRPGGIAAGERGGGADPPGVLSRATLGAQQLGAVVIRSRSWVADLGAGHDHARRITQLRRM